MPDYLIEIPGNQDVAAIDRAIRFEEQTPAAFVSSQVAYYGDQFTNLVKFNQLPANDDPADFKLLALNANPPAGFTKFWSGVMLVSGTNTMVVAYRKP